MDTQQLAQQIKDVEDGSGSAESNELDLELQAEVQDKAVLEILKSVRRAAMDLLARREHSRRELSQKLSKRFPETDLIPQVLDRLEEDTLLSDQRFTEAYIRARSNKGFGPQRVVIELREKGVSDTNISIGMDEAEVDWFELAERIRTKKFGENIDSDPKTKSKVFRFMSYRGFKMEHYS